MNRCARWIKENIWIWKTVPTMNRDEGSYNRRGQAQWLPTMVPARASTGATVSTAVSRALHCLRLVVNIDFHKCQIPSVVTMSAIRRCSSLSHNPYSIVYVAGNLCQFGLFSCRTSVPCYW